MTITWPELLGGGAILVADDMTLSRSVIARLLRVPGAPEVVEAGSAESALRQLNDPAGGRFRLLVSDFYMSGLNGLELIRQVRAGTTRAPHDLRVILLTGETDMAVIEVARRLDVDAVLPKPVTQAQLNQAVEQVLSRLRAVGEPLRYVDADMTPLAPLLE